MPIRKPMNRRRKMNRRKPTSKYTRGGSGQITAVKTLTVPDKIIVKLPYYSEFSLTSASNTAFHFWRNNSIYDPDGTGTGHQPLGYDQWKSFYGRYRVIGAKYRVTVANVTDTPCKVGLLGVNGAYTGATDESAFEHAHMKARVVGSQDGRDVAEFTKYFANPRIAGLSSITYKSDDRYQAQFGTNPLEQINTLVQARSLDPASGIGLKCSVHIIYYVELFDRNDLSISSTNPGAGLETPPDDVQPVLPS